MLLIRVSLYLVLLFFVMQLDAYLYLLDKIVIAPFIQVFLATVFTVVVYLFVKWRHIPVQISTESMVLLFCFIVYISVQILGIATWDAMPNDTMVLVYWVYMIVLLLMGAVTGALIEDRIPYVLFGLLVVLATITVIDTLSGGISVSEQWGRSASTLRNPNEAAFVVVLLLLGSMRWQRPGLLELLAVIIAGATIAMTQSRGGMLAYLVFVACYAIWWGSLGQTLGVRAKRYLYAFFFGIAAVGIASAALLIRRYGVDGMDGILSSALSDPNARDHAAKIAWELIKEKPFLGYGTGYVYTMQLGSHNMFLKVWLETGVPGLFGFLALFLGLLWLGIVRKDYSIITLVAVLLTIGLTTHNLMESRSILIVIGLLLANSARKKAAKRFVRNIYHDKVNIVTY